MDKELKKKIESWSLGKNNGKLIPTGGEILKSMLVGRSTGRGIKL